MTAPMRFNAPVFAPVFTGTLEAPSAHAATLVEVRPGTLLAAWFAGTHEGHPDVDIWCARWQQGKWGAAYKVASEASAPLWNPVLFKDREDVLWLFYKAGPNVPSWSGMYLRSVDGGDTWSEPAMLPAGILGPAKNKPITLSNGSILCGASVEAWCNWVAWAEIREVGRDDWTRYGPILPPDFGRSATAGIVSATWDAEKGELLLPQHFAGVIQPTVWEYAPGQVRMLLRSTLHIGAICVADSSDFGRTWTAARPTTLPNGNSGLDAVRMRDGRIALICNPTLAGRSPLSLLISQDNGETWPHRIDLERGESEYSYPSIIQGSDGLLHVIYTWRREQIRHAIVTPDLW